MFDCIIPLGQACIVSFLLDNAGLRKETSLFEWFVVKSLQTVTNVLEYIVRDEIPPITERSDGAAGVQIIDMNMYSGHYSLQDYIPKYKRRATRFIETIRSNKRIVFLRFDGGPLPSETEITAFFAIIRKLNLDIVMKLVYVRNMDKKETDVSLHSDLVYEYIPNEYISSDDILCKREPINEWFATLLKSIEN